ncbi:MAG: O-antigen ligase family protein [Patescibacteria group bacterium]|jgi:O-antigen ligase
MNTFVFVVVNALFVLTPLIFSTRSSELFEFPKLLVIYFGAALLLPLVIYKVYSNVNRGSRITDRESKTSIPQDTQTLRRSDARRVLIFASIGLFFISQLLSTYFSIDQHTSVFGYYSRFNGGILSLVSYLIIFASIYLFFSKEQVGRLLITIFFGGVLVALWGLPSHFGHDFICLLAQGSFSVSCWTAEFYPPARMFSTLGQPNWFATYLLVLAFVNLYLLAIGYRITNKISDQVTRNIYLILFALFSIEILWTNSKSGMIAYIVLVPLFFATLFIFKKNFAVSIPKRIQFFALFTYMAIGVLFALPYSGRIIQQFSPQKPKVTTSTTPQKVQQPDAQLNITPSTEIRKVVWQGAWELALQNPFFGTGVETFAYAYNFTRPMEHNKFSEWEFVYNKAHNELLNFAATSGFFGLGTYLLMFAAFLLPAVFYFLSSKTKSIPGEVTSPLRIFSLMYVLAMLGIFFMNLVGFSTTVSSLLFYSLPAMFLIMTRDEQLVTSDQRTTGNNRTTDSGSFLPTTPFILYVLFVVSSLFYFANYFMADYYYARAKEARQANDTASAYQYGQQAIDIRREPAYVDQQSFLSANIASSLTMQKDTKNAEAVAKQAILMNEEVLEGSPKNVFYLKTSAKVYYVLAMNYIDNQTRSTEYLNKAILALQRSMELAPTDPKIPYTLAAIIVDTKPEEAKKLLEQTISLKSDYTPAHELLEKITTQ